MNKTLLISGLFLALLFTSCTKDLGTVEVTYNKATAIYGDLNEVRATPLLDVAREVSNPGKIFIAEKLLLVGEEEEGVHVIDNSDPANPVPLHFISIPGNREFYVEDNQLFAESYYDMLKIDISDISQPILVSRVENAFAMEYINPEGQALIGFEFETVTERLDPESNHFPNDPGSNEWFYYDYAQNLIPASAVPASFAGNSGNAIGSVNRIAYADGHVFVVGTSKITVFKDAGALELLTSNHVGWQMETAFPMGEQLFVGTRNSMEIFDIANPASPSWLASFWHATSCDPVYPVGSVAYVTLRTGDVSNCPGDINALVVLDIENINNPTQRQEIEMESPFGMTMIGDKLFVGEGANGLKIFDATDRTNLVLDKWDQSVEAYDVIPHPVRADLVLIAGPGGLGQYKIDQTSTLDLVSWMSL